MRAREGDAGDGRLRDERAARCIATGHEIDRALRNPRAVHRLEQQLRAQGAAGRGLEHDGIARGQSAGHHVHRQSDRIVERRNDADDAKRTQHARRLLVGERAAQILRVTLVPLHLGAVVPDEVDRFLGFTERLRPRFPCFEQAGNGEVVLELFEPLRPLAQDGHPRRPRSGGPLREGSLRGRRGASNRGRRGRNETADGAGAIDGRGYFVPLAVVVAGARDDIGPVPAEQPRLDARNLAVEIVVHRSEIDADVRVGDAGKGIRHDVFPWTMTTFRRRSR